MENVESIERTYQSIGEFVVVFQWVEDLYRQIGWFILDPERKNWPPVQLRRKSNRELIDKVTELFVGLTKRYAFPNGTERANDFLELKPHFHEFRGYRNRLLHSTYIELKGGGELLGYIRANPRIVVDTDTGELIHDQEDFSADVMDAKLREYAGYMFRLSNHHLQLIHWSPFGRYAPQA